MIIGPYYTASDRVDFKVWAPFRERVDLHLTGSDDRIIPMEKDTIGYWQVQLKSSRKDIRYFFRLDDELERPDPASHFQPDGVHTSSQVINHRSFQWSDAQWRGLSLQEMVIYELHVGTFTRAGTFKAVIELLPHLKELGVNAIELMPVAQFPGERNWGYDGVFPFAVQNSYGGPEGLKTLVNACHQNGFAIILDVVYNHLGPEGNYFRDFGPYFTPKYRTPWGEALNFDDAYSDDVRNFFNENALYWFREFHIDALRLDAIHAILDRSAIPFLHELAQKIDTFSLEKRRNNYLIAESNLNDSGIVVSPAEGGYGLHAQWLDDYHHSLWALLTREKNGYYMDFGTLDQYRKALKEGFVYSGQYSAFRKRRHGNSSEKIDAFRFVVFVQNHDQVGNRMRGERLSELVCFPALKLAATACILSPYIPMIFMGEEYAEQAPFLYFIDHGDPDLIEAVRRGRKEEFREFRWEGEPPDPQDIRTFLKSKLNWSLKEKGKHKILLQFYRELINLKKAIPALCSLSNKSLQIKSDEATKMLFIHRWWEESNVFYVMHLDDNPTEFTLDLPAGRWHKILDGSDNRWDGPGSDLPDHMDSRQVITAPPWQVVLFERE